MKRWYIALFLAVLHAAPAVAGTAVTIYRNPSCGCCNIYADYLKEKGFDVKLVDVIDMASVKTKYAVPESLEGCHTAIIGKYVFEGLVPAEYLKQVVDERRPIRGLSVPGMPVGAPGMPGMRQGPIHVYYLNGGGSPHVFASF